MEVLQDNLLINNYHCVAVEQNSKKKKKKGSNPLFPHYAEFNLKWVIGTLLNPNQH